MSAPSGSVSPRIGDIGSSTCQAQGCPLALSTTSRALTTYKDVLQNDVGFNLMKVMRQLCAVFIPRSAGQVASDYESMLPLQHSGAIKAVMSVCSSVPQSTSWLLYQVDNK